MLELQRVAFSWSLQVCLLCFYFGYGCDGSQLDDDQIKISCVIPSDALSCQSSHILGLTEGDRFYIRCVNSNGNSLSTPISWAKSGEALTMKVCPAQTNVRCSIRGDSLIVYETTKTDEGIYTCATTDGHSEGLTIQIDALPLITQPPSVAVNTTTEVPSGKLEKNTSQTPEKGVWTSKDMSSVTSDTPTSLPNISDAFTNRVSRQGGHSKSHLTDPDEGSNKTLIIAVSLPASVGILIVIIAVVFKFRLRASAKISTDRHEETLQEIRQSRKETRQEIQMTRQETHERVQQSGEETRKEIQKNGKEIQERMQRSGEQTWKEIQQTRRETQKGIQQSTIETREEIQKSGLETQKELRQFRKDTAAGINEVLQIQLEKS